MSRGDLVTVALQGDFGKPRPALVIQSDLFADHSTVTVLLVTSTLVDAPMLRVTVHPNAANGLERASQIMVDRAMSVRASKIGEAFGRLDAADMREIERRLAMFLAIVK